MGAAMGPGFVTRFAPSPTGLLHRGHALSALTAFQASRRNRLKRVKAGGRSWATKCFSDTTLGSRISNDGEWITVS